MLEKYKQNHFGRCPRFLCANAPCLPVGTSDIFRTATVKIFCPKCKVSRVFKQWLIPAYDFGTRIFIFQGVSIRVIRTEPILARRSHTCSWWVSGTFKYPNKAIRTNPGFLVSRSENIGSTQDANGNTWLKIIIKHGVQKTVEQTSCHFIPSLWLQKYENMPLVVRGR